MADNGECILCGGADFMLSDGMFFCSECGTQSQHAREELTAKDEQVSYVRRIKKSIVKKEEKDEVDATIVEKMQIVLKLQCDALVDLGFDPSLKEAAKLIWFKYLQYSGYAFQDSAVNKVPTMHDQLTTVQLKQKNKAAVQSTTEELRQGASQHFKRNKKEPNLMDKSETPTLTPFVTRGGSRTTPGGQISGQPRNKRARKGECPARNRTVVKKMPVKRKIDFNAGCSESEEEEPNPLDTLPDDAHLFDESLDLNSGTESEVDVDLYHRYLKEETVTTHMRYLSLKQTVIICYLALLYTGQTVLLSDYARWIRLHKIPFHNVLSLLPRSYFLNKAMIFWRTKADLKADRLYLLLRQFLWYLPLPPLPQANPTAMCHALIDRLHLSAYFKKMVDKCLRCVFRPDLEGPSKRKNRQFEMECMGLIMYLMKSIYRLDDDHEFEMVELVRGEEMNLSEEEPHIYLWEDWMTWHCRKKIQSLSSDIPLNKSELSRVSDHSKFVDFCHHDVLLKARAYPLLPDGLRHWNPALYNELSEIFKQARKKTTPTDHTSNEKEMPEIRPPRRVYISDLLKWSKVNWKQFDWFPENKQVEKFENIDLSRSFKFLLETCAEILDMTPSDLYFRMHSVETYFKLTSVALRKVDLLMEEMYHMEPHNASTEGELQVHPASQDHSPPSSPS